MNLRGIPYCNSIKSTKCIKVFHQLIFKIGILWVKADDDTSLFFLLHNLDYREAGDTMQCGLVSLMLLHLRESSVSA